MVSGIQKTPALTEGAPFPFSRFRAFLRSFVPFPFFARHTG